jgi:hypothetical protein
MCQFDRLLLVILGRKAILCVNLTGSCWYFLARRKEMEEGKKLVRIVHVIGIVLNKQVRHWDSFFCLLHLSCPAG